MPMIGGSTSKGKKEDCQVKVHSSSSEVETWNQINTDMCLCGRKDVALL